MVIRNLVKFREWVKKEYGAGSDNLHPHYMGIQTTTENAKKFGFYYLFHGINRSGLRNALFGSLQLAEDTQGIYEFIQNSADCGATYFSIFYNEDYFLAFNNGAKFTNSNVIAILNEGDSDKTDGSSIGRFGVGFKIVHRLVGETDGLNELVNEEEPRGPVIFSWDKKSDIEAFIDLSDNDLIKENSSEEFEDKTDKGNYPWLFKILLTNFPTAPTEQEFETVKGLDDFKTKKGGFYTKKELREFVDFLNLFKAELENKTGNKFFDNGNGLFDNGEGSLFFIKLGKDKNKKIDKDIEKLEDGVQFSLNFLGYDSEQNDTEVVRQLKTINLNNREFTTRQLEKEDVFIKHTDSLFKKLIHGESTTPIKITFGYQAYKDDKDTKEKSLNLRKRPNFFKFFPMDKETVGLNFVVHSDAFIIEKSRRELQQDDPRNILIFEYLIEYLAQQLNSYQEIPVNSEYFLDIYAAILTSREPREAHLWIKFKLYDPLLEYLKGNIPTIYFQDFDKPIERRVKHSITHVKSKKTQLTVKPSELGLSNIEWFFWNKKDYQKIESEAFIKLGLERWDIIDLIEESIYQGHIQRVNQWISELSKDDYKTLLEEINNSERINSFESEELRLTKLFKCSDELFYSIDDFLNKEKNVVFTFNLIHAYQGILNQIGIKTSTFNVEKYINIKNQIKEEIKYLGDLQSDLYDDYIKPKFPNDVLNAEQKIKLFNLLLSSDFKGVNILLKNLPIFYDTNKTHQPLDKLLSINDNNIPSWLNSFKIHQDFENFKPIDTYLIKSDDIYSDVIVKYWGKIILEINDENVKQFYEDVSKFFNNEKHIGLTNSQQDKFIYTNTGFKSRKEVFYHQKIGNTQNIISRFLSKKSFPLQSILKYFNKTNSPFYIKQDSLVETAQFEKIQFTEKEAIQFLEYAKAANEEIFKIGYFTNNYQFIADTNQKQFFSNNEEESFLNFINHHFSNDYKMLPETLAKVGDFSFLGLKTSGIRQEITEKVIFENKNLFEAYFNIVASFGEQLKKVYLKKITKIELSTAKTYHENSFEYKAILLYLNHYKTYREFREKIFINNIQLTTIKYKEEVQLTTSNNKTISIPYAQILPNDADNNSILIDKMIKQFQEDVFKNIFVREIDDVNKVYLKLRKSYPKFINLYQFAFVLYHQAHQLQVIQYQHFNNKNIVDFFFEHQFEVTDKLISIVALNANAKINIFPSKYALGNEQLDQALQDWIRTDVKKEKFISLFGVFISHSSVVKLRQFFLNESTFNDANIAIAQLSERQTLLQNTIIWLSNQALKFNATTDNQKIVILGQLFSKLSTCHNSLPLPIITQFENNQSVFSLQPRKGVTYWYPEKQEHRQYFTKIFEIIRQKQFQIIDKKFFNPALISQFKNIKNIENDIKTELDIEELKKINRPLTNDFYLEWKKDFPNKTIHQVVDIPHKETFFGHKLYATPPYKIIKSYEAINNNFYIKGNVLAVFKKNNIAIYNQLKEYQQYIFIKEKLDTVQHTGHSINNIKSHQLLERLLHHAKGKVFQVNDTRLNIIKDIYSKMNITTNTHPLILMKIASNGIISYEVNNKKSRLFKSLHTLPITIQEKIKIQQIINQNNYSLLADNHLSNIPGEQLAITEKIDTSNIIKLWDAEHYNKWTHKNTYKVYLMNGQVQYHKQFLNQNISTTKFRKGNVYTNDNIIYINQNLNIDKELEKIIPFQFFKSLKQLKVDTTIDVQRAKIINTYDISAYELEVVLAEWRNKKNKPKPIPKPPKSKPNILQKILGFFTRSSQEGVDVEKTTNDKTKLVNTQSFPNIVDYEQLTTLNITPEQWSKINNLQPNEEYYIAYQTSSGQIKYLRIVSENL